MNPRIRIIVVASLIVGFVSIGLFLREPRSSIPPFPMDKAEKLTVDQLADKYQDNGTLVLPTWMPDRVLLREIYHLGALTIMVYCRRNDRDYREADVCIEMLKKTTDPPTREQIQEIQDNHSSGEILDIGEYWVVISRDAEMAYFWHDGFYYLLSAKGKYSKEDMVNIVAGMKPVGQGTLRKTTTTNIHERVS